MQLTLYSTRWSYHLHSVPLMLNRFYTFLLTCSLLVIIAGIQLCVRVAVHVDSHVPAWSFVSWSIMLNSDSICPDSNQPFEAA